MEVTGDLDRRFWWGSRDRILSGVGSERKGGEDVKKTSGHRSCHKEE